MKITKFGHNCLLIEEGGLRVLTDPQLELAGLDLERLLLTHRRLELGRQLPGTMLGRDQQQRLL